LWRQILAPLAGVAVTIAVALLWVFVLGRAQLFLSHSQNALLQQGLYTAGLLVMSLAGGFVGGWIAARWFLGAIQGALMLGVLAGIMFQSDGNWTLERVALVGSIFFFCPLIAYLALAIRHRRRLLKQRPPVFTFEGGPGAPDNTTAG